MGIKQPSLSAIENRGNDLKISTMKKYVEAMGDKLRIDVELPTGKHVGFTVWIYSSDYIEEDIGFDAFETSAINCLEHFTVCWISE